MHRHSKSVEPTGRNPEPTWSMDSHTIETATRTYLARINQASRMHEEAMRFAQRRFTKELDAAVQLAGCTHPTEAFAVQAAFANDMAADCFADGQELVELMGEMPRGISSSPESDRKHH